MEGNKVDENSTEGSKKEIEEERMGKEENGLQPLNIKMLKLWLHPWM